MPPPSKHFPHTPPDADDSEDDERRNPLREEPDTFSTDTSRQLAWNNLDSTYHFCDDIPASLGMTDAPGPAPQPPATEEPVTGSGQGDNLITTMVSFDNIQRYPLLDEEVSNDSITDEMVGPPAKRAKLLAQIGSTLDQASHNPLDERDETTTTKKLCSLSHQYSIASVVLRVVSDIQPNRSEWSYVFITTESNPSL